MARSIIDIGRSFADFSGLAGRLSILSVKTMLTRLRPRAWACAAAAFISAMLVLPMPAWAITFDYEAKLAPFAGNLSPWGGTGAVNPISIDKFIGPQWNAAAPPIDFSLKYCGLIVCVGYGVDGYASTNGKLGFDFGLHASGGSVQVGLPMSVGLNVSPGIRGTSNPDPVISFPVNGFSIEPGGFSYLGQHGVLATGPPTLASFAPTFDAHLNAVTQIGFSVGGHICYVFCVGGDVSEQLGGSVPLFNLGPAPGGGYSASVIGLGELTLPLEVNLGTNIATLMLNVPDVNTNSSVHGGFDAATQTVTSMADGKVFGLSLDLAALAGNVLPILYPFVGEHSIGGIGSYDLLSASIGVFVSYVEKFIASVKDVIVGFVFSDPVSVNGAPASYFSLPDVRGKDLVITPAPGSNGFNSIGVVPVFYVQAGIHHQPSLALTLEGELKVLDFSLAGHNFDPVARVGFETDLGQFNLPSFDTVSDYIGIAGLPFNIYPGGPPISEALCVTGLCSNHEFRQVRRTTGSSGTPIAIAPGATGGNAANADPSLQPYGIWLVDGSCRLDTPPHLCRNGLYIGDTSLSSFTDAMLDDLIFTNAASLTPPPGLQGPILAANYATDWLSQHGVTADAPPFPAFAPFQFPRELIGQQVPEPGTIGLVIAGMIAIACARRRPCARAAHGIA